MKVTCPHCGALYSIDDRRIPATGLNVKCPKCAAAFPVRREAAPPAPPAEELSFGAPQGAIPLPAPENPFAPPPPAAVEDNPFALPPPAVEDNPFALPPPASAGEPFAFEEVQGSIPLPAPENPFALPPPDLAPSPFDAGPAAPSPFDAAPISPPPLEAPPLAFGDIEFDVGGPGAEPTAPPAAPPSPDPFGAATAGEELEDLYGAEGPSAAQGGDASGPLSMDQGFHVRRRSGKVFGPFPAGAVAEMLQKGELQGNEDVSSDGGGSWKPMSAIPAFRDAAGQAHAPPVQAVPSVPFGARMAPVKVGEEGRLVAAGRPRWLKVAVVAAAVLVLAGVGVAGALTPYGLFFHRAFRSSAERARVAGLVAGARTGLSRGDFASEKEALRQAGDALVAAPDDAEARLAYVLAAGAVQRRHAAPPDALQRAA
ncbi:MAG TPA: zinc-ribbon domain-containing protein, partial [Anaeromyxobacteraceae bacterium]|nr:zinc-ribbon domain-containing protein [Anaeromyxobacteraceae bacterium]